MTYTKGIDISHWNAWESPQRAWEAGARFVIVRFGSIANLTGEVYTDYDLENNMQLLKDWNANNPDKILAVAIYFYGRLNHDVIKQAQFIADMVDYIEFDLGVKVGFIVWDQEEAGDAELLRVGMTEAEHRSGKVCVLYTNLNAWKYLLRGDKSWGVFFDLWQAQWTLANMPDLLEPWHPDFKWSLWQYSSKNGLGIVFGGAGHPEGTADMDLNYFNGSEAEMYDYFNYSPDEPLPPEPEPLPVIARVVSEKPQTYSAVVIKNASNWQAASNIGLIYHGAQVEVIGEEQAPNGNPFKVCLVRIPAGRLEIMEAENE